LIPLVSFLRLEREGDLIVWASLRHSLNDRPDAQIRLIVYKRKSPRYVLPI
jgi:hypothetical protein